MNTSHSMIEPIFKRNFGNIFQHQNGPNQCQNTHKNTSQQYQHINTIKKYQNRNTGQQYQHINNSQKYQPISFQIYRKPSTPYLKENCLICGLKNKGAREALIQYDGTLENFTFLGPLYTHTKAPR